MAKLMLRPDADGYQAQDGTTVLRTALAGGAGRYRRDKLGATKMVTVKWTMNPVQYEYWRAFFVTATKEGALPFTCDLVSEDGRGPVEHTCSFIPGSVGMPSQQGFTYVQAATLEVTPIPHDTAHDLALIEIFNESEGAPDAWLNALAQLVNVTMPETIGA